MPESFLLKKKLLQVFSCEICEIFQNTFFTEHLRTTAPVHLAAGEAAKGDVL